MTPRLRRGGLIRFLGNARETVTLAFDSLRASKLRSGLTILGVVIGVSVVMAMASIVQGIRDQIVVFIRSKAARVYNRVPGNANKIRSQAYSVRLLSEGCNQNSRIPQGAARIIL